MRHSECDVLQGEKLSDERLAFTKILTDLVVQRWAAVPEETLLIHRQFGRGRRGARKGFAPARCDNMRMRMILCCAG